MKAAKNHEANIAHKLGKSLTPRSASSDWSMLRKWTDT